MHLPWCIYPVGTCWLETFLARNPHLCEYGNNDGRNYYGIRNLVKLLVVYCQIIDLDGYLPPIITPCRCCFGIDWKSKLHTGHCPFHLHYWHHHLKLYQILQQMCRDMRLPLMWYVPPAKLQICLRIHAA